MTNNDPIRRVESFLQLSERYFTWNNFVKRDDGFFCVKKHRSETPINTKIIKKPIHTKFIKKPVQKLGCMPPSKGRVPKPEDELTAENEKTLYDFYRSDNLKMGVNKFSWFSKFEP